MSNSNHTINFRSICFLLSLPLICPYPSAMLLSISLLLLFLNSGSAYDPEGPPSSCRLMYGFWKQCECWVVILFALHLTALSQHPTGILSHQAKCGTEAIIETFWQLAPYLGTPVNMRAEDKLCKLEPGLRLNHEAGVQGGKMPVRFMLIQT